MSRNRKRCWTRQPVAMLGAGLLMLAPATLAAAQTRRFVLDTPRALAGATATGVAIFPDGSLRALPPLGAVATFEEPLGLALAVADDGAAYVGTGSPARVYRVHAGAKQLMAELAADQVTALLLGPDGALWAGTAIPAVLYRLPRGASRFEEVSRLAEGNLWDLAWFRGALVAAAGNPGRLLRLGAKGLELAAEIPDRHARCLAVAGDVLLVGTSGDGYVLRWDGAAPPGALYDSSFTEIAALAVAPTGVVYAAGLTGDPTLGKPPAKPEGEGTPTVTVTAGEAGPPPPSTDKGTATSEILRILPQGAATSVHRFSKQIAGALAWGDGGLVIGTGLEGELWQLVEGSAARLDTVDASQVVRLAAGGRWALVQGPVRLLRRDGPPRGSFTSPALDAGQPARWGEFSVRAAAAGRCMLRFRSGATAQPDATWSAWTAPSVCSPGLVAAPPARYLQWEIALEPEGSAGGRVDGVTVGYRQVNLPPEVRELTVHQPGEVFLKSPPSSERIVEVQHPDLAGIFTTIGDDDKDYQDRLGKKYYRVGYQSLSWKVDEPNGDPLRFTIEVQRQSGERWWPVRSGLETVNLAIDTQALPDGLYRFRLTATDAPANPEAPATASTLSSWVLVDNSPPRITAKRDGEHWRVTVEDALSPLTVLEWSRDADEWRQVLPDDGVLDGRRESFRIPAERGAHLVALRAVDDHHNRATAALEETP